MNRSFLNRIGRSCLNVSKYLDNNIFFILRKLGIGLQVPTRRGTRAGRLHRLWYDQPLTLPRNAICKALTPAPIPVVTVDKMVIGPSNPVPATPTTNKSLGVCLLNSQSVNPVGKADLISDFIVENNVDILFITETWLRPGDDPKCNELTPVGYFTSSFPRPTGVGGGIAVVYKQHLHAASSFSDSLPFLHTTFEAVEFTVATTTTVSFLCIYRPPPNAKNKLNDATFFEEFGLALDHYNVTSHSAIILGDFNIHWDCPSNVNTKRARTLLDSYSLDQVVPFPTHCHGHILDWIVTRPSDNLVSCLVASDHLVSDHSAVSFIVNITRPVKKRKIVTRRKLRAIDTDAFGEEAALLFAQRDPSSDPASFFTLSLRQLLDRHAPPSLCAVSERPPAPWFSDDVKSAKQERRRAERAWRLSGLEVNRQIFREKRLRVKEAITAAKVQHFHDRITQASSTKELFSILHTLLGSTPSSPLPTTHPSDELPELFSQYFKEKIENLRCSLNQDVYRPSPPSPCFSGSPLSCFQPVTIDLVKRIATRTPIKTCELDPLPSFLFTKCLDKLLPFITDIINFSLSTGIFPDCFKSAIVRPLLKKSGLDVNECQNYRPVSNLPFLSKLLERVVLEQLNEHLSLHSLMPAYQSAYRHHHSTETALLRITTDLLNASDRGLVSALVLLDLSAAFDTIDHHLLIDRLSSTFGIQDIALSWFRSYLHDRSQTVTTESLSSRPVPVRYGVPQGSVLGPVLFTLYTQPLALVIERHNLKYHSFADDTQLYNSAKPDDFDELLASISICFLDIKNWMTENKLKLNSEKTEALVVGTRQKLASLTATDLQLADATVPFSPTVKSLGVYLDSTLSMQSHISFLTKTCFYHLRCIAAIRPYLTQEACVKLVISLLFSRIDYCNSLLAGLPASSLQGLQRVQNCAARLVLKKKRSEHITPLLRSLHWLPINNRITYKLASICYKCLNDSAPEYLRSCLELYTQSRPLRSASDALTLRIPRVKLVSAGQRAFSYTGPSAWNPLPLQLRQSPSFDSFRSWLKTQLFL